MWPDGCNPGDHLDVLAGLRWLTGTWFTGLGWLAGLRGLAGLGRLAVTRLPVTRLAVALAILRRLAISLLPVTRLTVLRRLVALVATVGARQLRLVREREEVAGVALPQLNEGGEADAPLDEDEDEV